MLRVEIQSGKQLHVVSAALLPFPTTTVSVTAHQHGEGLSPLLSQKKLTILKNRGKVEKNDLEAVSGAGGWWGGTLNKA